MDTVIVASSQFYSHYPKRIPQGTVNAEAVLVRLDSEWDNLTVRIHWLNVASGVEKVVLLERDQPNTIPWEVLTDLGELRMGLDGMDGGTIVKPTVWLTYGYVVDGVDPESGSDPQPPTPSWEQQMVEQATQANQAAQAAQQAAEEAAKAVASAGPYAEEAKKSAEAAKASQDAAATSAQKANEAAQTAQNAAGSIGDSVKRAEDAATAAENAQAGAAQSAGTAQTAATTAGQAAQDAQSAATQAGEYLDGVNAAAGAATDAAISAGKSKEAAQSAAQEAANARDQATTAATTAQGHADAAGIAKAAAEQAATTADNAQSGAAQSAQSAASSASAAQAAQQAAESAAAAFPPLTEDVANKFLAADSEGKKLIFMDPPSGGGGAGGELLLAEYIHQGNQEIYFSSFDWASGIGECTEPHGLITPIEVMLVPNNWWMQNVGAGVPSIPIEWLLYNNSIYLVPDGESQVKITGNDKSTPISVDLDDVSNAKVDFSRFHVEIPVGFDISELPVEPLSMRITAYGYIMNKRYRYVNTKVKSESGKVNISPYTEGRTALGGVGISKAYHAIPFFYDMSMELWHEKGVISYVGSNQYRGQRSGYSYFVNDVTTEEYRKGFVGLDVDDKVIAFSGIKVWDSYACYSNNTIFRLYAKGVRPQ